MRVVLPSDELDQKANDVEAFLNAYRTLWSLTGPLPQWGISSLLDGPITPEIRVQVDRVEDAAGVAAPAVNASGMLQTFSGSPFDPVADWRNSFNPGHPNTSQLVEGHAQQIIGQYRQLARMAKEREHGFTGLIARFIRFPYEVRRAAGLTSRAGQRGAFLVGVAIQAIGTVIAAGILAAIGFGVSHLI